MLKNQPFTSADVFIIPNPVATPAGEAGCNNFGFANELQSQFYRNDCQSLEGLKSTTTKYIQLWFVTPKSVAGDNDQSNWRDHGIDGYPELEGWRLDCEWFPAELFKGHKEGDVVTVVAPITRYDAERGVTESATIKIACNLKQSDYRYCRFGTFEEALEYVAYPR